MTARLSGIGMTSARTRERLVGRLREAGIRNEAVLDAMRRIPRHLFVDEALAHRAYEDTALPIGHNQTISEPYTAARMTSVVVEHSPTRVLEVGTGCGYQAAVLAPLVKELFTIERISALHQKARMHLAELRIHNVKLRHGDGYQGWASMGPFDAISHGSAERGARHVAGTACRRWAHDPAGGQGGRATTYSANSRGERI